MEAGKVKEKKCLICKSKLTNVRDYGEWKTLEDVTVHYYCLLLSTGLLQNGEDDDGILGFLLDDIRKFAKTLTKKKCKFCKLKSASIKCNECRTLFHLICGENNGCQNQFFDEYKSFCNKHIQLENKQQHGLYRSCLICQEPMGEYDQLNSIPSCCNVGWYHRSCTRQNALSQGYLLKCPSCGNESDHYRKLLTERGIFIPDQDAAWEQSQDAYESLLFVYQRCDANECLCEKGREYRKGDGKWNIIVCELCGSEGIHAACFPERDGGFICSKCKLDSQPASTSAEIPSTQNGQSHDLDDKSEENEKNSQIKPKKTDSGENSANRKRKQPEPIWEMASVHGYNFKKSTLMLREPGNENKIEPFGLEERTNLQNERLKHFFKRGLDFRVPHDEYKDDYKRVKFE